MSADFDQNWSFAIPIPDMASARKLMEEGKPKNLPEPISLKVDACIVASMVILNHGKMGEGPFSVAISGKGNKVYLSLQEVGKNAVL